MQCGRWPPTWKPLKRYISAAILPILMKFGMVTHTGPLQQTDHYNFKFLKIQDGGGRYIGNSDNENETKLRQNARKSNSNNTWS